MRGTCRRTGCRLSSRDRCSRHVCHHRSKAWKRRVKAVWVQLLFAERFENVGKYRLTVGPALSVPLCCCF